MYQELNREVSHRQPYPFGKKGYAGNPIRMYLNHVQADEISFFVEPNASECFEAAFFNHGKWVTDLMGEFEPYAEPEAGETRVYRYIPKAVLDNFLEHHAISENRW